LPKDGKIIRPLQKNVILTVRELPFCLLYCLFGLLMPGQMHQLTTTKPNLAEKKYFVIQVPLSLRFLIKKLKLLVRLMSQGHLLQH
jgi:hypothetical protein